LCVHPLKHSRSRGHGARQSIGDRATRQGRAARVAQRPLNRAARESRGTGVPTAGEPDAFPHTSFRRTPTGRAPTLQRSWATQGRRRAASRSAAQPLKRPAVVTHFPLFVLKFCVFFFERTRSTNKHPRTNSPKSVLRVPRGVLSCAWEAMMQGAQQPRNTYGNFPAPAGYGMHYQGQAAPSLSAPHYFPQFPRQLGDFGAVPTNTNYARQVPAAAANVTRRRRSLLPAAPPGARRMPLLPARPPPAAPPVANPQRRDPPG